MPAVHRHHRTATGPRPPSAARTHTGGCFHTFRCLWFALVVLATRSTSDTEGILLRHPNRVRARRRIHGPVTLRAAGHSGALLQMSLLIGFDGTRCDCFQSASVVLLSGSAVDEPTSISKRNYKDFSLGSPAAAAADRWPLAINPPMIGLSTVAACGSMPPLVLLPYFHETVLCTARAAFDWCHGEGCHGCATGGRPGGVLRGGRIRGGNRGGLQPCA